MFYYDTRYIMMLLPVLAITLYAQWKVNSSFRNLRSCIILSANDNG